jgi:hypothetical protein
VYFGFLAEILGCPLKIVKFQNLEIFGGKFLKISENSRC